MNNDGQFEIKLRKFLKYAADEIAGGQTDIPAQSKEADKFIFENLECVQAGFPQLLSMCEKPVRLEDFTKLTAMALRDEFACLLMSDNINKIYAAFSKGNIFKITITKV